MHVLALRPGDSAWAVSNKYSLRYLGKRPEGHKFELAFEDRAAFSVVAGKSVSVTTVWAHIPEPLVMQAESKLRIGVDLITIRELSGGKVAVNYFGAGQFTAVHLVSVEAAKAGTLIAQR